MIDSINNLLSQKTIHFLLLTCCYFTSTIPTEVIISKSNELEKCLLENWGVDYHTATYILNKFHPFLEDTALHIIIDNFIDKSKKITINFSSYQAITPLHPEDGTLQAPKQHLIIFENPWIRILWGSTISGEHENLHIHTWKSIMVVIKATTYEIHYPDGTTTTEHWPVGAYELPGMEKYSCKNIGNTADECLRFEIKE